MDIFKSHGRRFIDVGGLLMTPSPPPGRGGVGVGEACGYIASGFFYMFAVCAFEAPLQLLFCVGYIFYFSWVAVSFI
jgi:hypothetical protein